MYTASLQNDKIPKQLSRMVYMINSRHLEKHFNSMSTHDYRLVHNVMKPYKFHLFCIIHHSFRNERNTIYDTHSVPNIISAEIETNEVHTLTIHQEETEHCTNLQL